MPDGPQQDPLQHRAYAEAIVDRAATQLRELLKTLAGQIQPFPAFPGAMFAYGIEVDPPPGSDLGCVVLADDGELYELQIGLDDEEIARGGDHVATRQEDTHPLDLPPADYVTYAYRAVQAAVAELEARQQAPSR